MKQRCAHGWRGQWLGLAMLLATWLAAESALAAVAFRAAASASSQAGAAITFVAGGNAASANGGNVTPTLPAGIQAGDLLLCQVESHDIVAHSTTAAGWTQLYTLTGTAHRASLFYKIAAGGDANLTVTHAGGNSIIARCSAFRGVDPASPFDVSHAAQYTASGLLINSGSLTTVTSGAMTLFAAHINNNPGSLTWPAGWTQSFYSNTSQGSDSALGLGRLLQAAPATVGPLQATASGDPGESHGVLLALRPLVNGLVINVPAGTVAGDVMIASLAVRPSTIALTAPAGWTLVRPPVTQSSSTSSVLYTYRKVAGSGEPASYTWIFSGGAHAGAVGGIASFSGVDNTTPIDAEAGVATGNSLTHTAPSVTTTLPDGMLVTIHEFASSATWTPPAGMSEAVDVRSGALGSAGIALEMNYQARPTAGATGTRSATASNNADRGATQSVSLKPAPMSCFTDNFNRANGAPGADWAASSVSGSFGAPKIVANRLRLTDSTLGVSTMATLLRMFPGAGNRIETEFDHYAYGGSGADGITLTYSDYTVAPVAGAFGGSLGYAQKGAGSDCPNCPGFAGGWLGLGIDEYGNFSAATEGRVGGPGLTLDSVAVRGSGSGLSGYAYHTGTATLNPQVDNNGGAVPAHRYRIVIDHSNGSNAWVSVARNTGAGFITLVAPYDAKAQAGQAAVPANWLLSLTGSTGASTNIHEIDNLQVCATAQALAPALHHFEIAVAAAASTCQPQSVTIVAKDILNNTLTGYIGVIALATSSGHGDWALSTGGGAFSNGIADDGSASYTFVAGDSGTVTLSLDNQRAENLTITSVDATVPTSSSSSGVVSYLDNAFVVSATDALGDVVVAGRPHAMKAELWRCTRVNPSTCNRCSIATGYTGVTRNLDAWYSADAEHPAAAAAPGIGALTLPAVAPASNPASNNLALTFTNGVATFNLASSDVGKYTLSLRDDTRTFAGAVDIIGTSPTLTARPFALAVSDIKTLGATPVLNPAAGYNPGDAAFTSAGTSFQATLGGYLYNAAADADNDGVPDTAATLAQVTANGVAPRFAAAVNLGAGLTAAGETSCPGPNAGAFSPATINITAGSVNPQNLSFSEVGCFKLVGGGAGGAAVTNYLGTAGVDLPPFVFKSTGAQDHTVGRFHPHHFALSATSISNRAQSVCTPASTFTYAGEQFQAGLTLTAQNLGNGTTANYASANSFAKFDGNTIANFNFGAVDWADAILPLAATPNLGLGLVSSSGSWTAGVGEFTANLGVQRAAAPDGPYESFHLGTAPADSDGVALATADLDVDNNGSNDHGLVGASIIRYGRLKLGSAHGSELLDLPIPLEAQYWNGTAFVTNTADNCTTLSTGNIALGNYQPAPAPPLDITNMGAGHISFSGPFLAGKGNLKLLKPVPVPTSKGSVEVTVDLSVGGENRTYLQGAWTGSTYSENPSARATFGVYKSPDQFIYLRENY